MKVFQKKKVETLENQTLTSVGTNDVNLNFLMNLYPNQSYVFHLHLVNFLTLVFILCYKEALSLLFLSH